MQAQELWNRVLLALKDEINPQTHKTWLDPLKPVAIRDGHLVMEATDTFIRDWVEENFLSTINKALSVLGGDRLRLQLVLSENPPVPPPSPAEQRPFLPEPPQPRGNSSNLNPRYTFESFVVGGSNQFAHAAALAVADQPARSYNPLFLYGGVGLGKTHLMHAIGHRVKERNRDARLCYISSEKFMNELINSIRFDRMPQFRDMYRTVDVLLVDDIQFIAGKDRTQEEFFHTFNALFDSHKQIVVSSDKYPREIPDLEERLRSRFEWGLVADIQPPDLETKMAILNKKAELNGMELPSEVTLFLAQNTTSNIRELEGYLLRILAFASIRRTQSISMDLVREALKDFLEQKKKVVSVEQIQRKVCLHFDVKVSDLKSKRKNKALIAPRHIAFYISRQLTAHSLPEIGRLFGGRDHSTVLHGLQKIEAMIQNDRAFEQTVLQLMKEIEED